MMRPLARRGTPVEIRTATLSECGQKGGKSFVCLRCAAAAKQRSRCAVDSAGSILALPEGKRNHQRGFLPGGAVGVTMMCDKR